MVAIVKVAPSYTIATYLGVSKECIHAVINNRLKMTNVSALQVPKLLGPDEKQTLHNVSRDNLDTFEVGLKISLAFHLRLFCFLSVRDVVLCLGDMVSRHGNQPPVVGADLGNQGGCPKESQLYARIFFRLTNALRNQFDYWQLFFKTLEV